MFICLQFPASGNEGIPNQLLFKQALTISRAECQQRIGQQQHLIHEGTLCTLSQDGMGTCRGDAGGPLLTDQGVIVGVNSWALSCATRNPDVYTRVWPYMAFIRGTTGIRS